MFIPVGERGATDSPAAIHWEVNGHANGLPQQMTLSSRMGPPYSVVRMKRPILKFIIMIIDCPRVRSGTIYTAKRICAKIPCGSLGLIPMNVWLSDVSSKSVGNPFTPRALANAICRSSSTWVSG